MSTALKDDAKLVGPLDHLRGTIRRYVVAEGLLVAAIFVVAWTAVGLLLDFGLFKATTWDWVLDAPAWVRGIGLVLMATLLVLLIASRVFARLTKDFSYPALAMVLERRFPNALGDRLITAVELSDVKKAATYGFSEDMINATIVEARKRVAIVPVNEVFNWNRLWRLSFTLAGLVGLLFVGSIIAYLASTKERSPLSFFWHSAHIASIWSERNLALMHTPWPRQVHLEYVNFPADELRVAKDAALTKPVAVRVRAAKWVVADPSAPVGWRPMLWSDVPILLGDEALKSLPIARSAVNASGPLTVDQVEYVNGLTGAIDRLNSLADDPANARRLRRLEIPRVVTFAFEGSRTQGDGPLKMESTNEFVGELKELAESVAVSVWAEDFRMPAKKVTLVPSPMLSRLVRTQYEPAYLHHSPPDQGTYADLKGLRQRMPDQDVSLTGEKSVFSAPAGTEIVLTATSDKPLKAAYLRPRVGKLPGAAVGSGDLVPLTVNATGDGFSTTISGSWYAEIVQAMRGPIRVNDALEFDLVYDDTDGVRAQRTVLVQKQEDQPPTVDLAVDILRRQGSVYLATPLARVPFIAESVVRDDRGLSKVEYTFEYSLLEAPVVVALQGKLVARVFASAPGPVGFATVVMPAIDATIARVLSKSDAKQKGSAVLAGYNDLSLSLVRDTRIKLLDDLKKPLAGGPPSLVKIVKIENPQKDYFDIEKVLQNLVAPATEVQPRYRIDLNVQGTDTNVENPEGPKKATNISPIQLLVVSEADLLVEISKEEEGLILRVDEALRRLREAQRKLSEMAGIYETVPANEIINLAVRGIDIGQDIAKGRDVTGSVLTDYRRILRECEVNRVQKATVDRFRSVIVNPLYGILEDASEGSYRNAEMAVGALQAPLNESRKPDFATMDATQKNVKALVDRLQKIRDELGESLTLAKLRDGIQAILKRQQDVRLSLKELDEDLKGKLFKPDVRPAGPVALGKGESKKVKHAIDWKLYDKDDLVIRFLASDPSLKVPTEVKIPADQLDFEYEVTAGQKAGDFTVTVMPVVGKPVVVRVSVK